MTRTPTALLANAKDRRSMKDFKELSAVALGNFEHHDSRVESCNNLALTRANNPGNEGSDRQMPAGNCPGYDNTLWGPHLNRRAIQVNSEDALRHKCAAIKTTNINNHIG